MRTTVSFALDQDEAKKVKELVTKRGFTSTSDYFRFLIAEDDVELISQDEVLKRMKSVSKLAKHSRLIKVKSLRDLV